MTTRAPSKALLAIIVTLFGCDRASAASAAPSAGIDEPTEKTLEVLVRSPHGLASLSHDNRVRLEMIKRDPTPYLAVIRRKYPSGAVARLVRDQRAAYDFMTTAAVLGEIDSPTTADILAPWYVELDDAILVERDSTAVPKLQRMQDEVLAALRGHPRDVVLNRILGRLQQIDRPKRIFWLRYLLSSSQGNAEVIQRLRAFHDAPESRLHGDPDLAKVIPRLSGDRRAADGGSEGP